jgi:hypothetical protein
MFSKYLIFSILGILTYYCNAYVPNSQHIISGIDTWVAFATNKRPSYMLLGGISYDQYGNANLLEDHENEDVKNNFTQDDMRLLNNLQTHYRDVINQMIEGKLVFDESAFFYSGKRLGLRYDFLLAFKLWTVSSSSGRKLTGRIFLTASPTLQTPVSIPSSNKTRMIIGFQPGSSAKVQGIFSDDDGKQQVTNQLEYRNDGIYDI